MTRRRTLLEDLAEMNSTAPQDIDPEDMDNNHYSLSAKPTSVNFLDNPEDSVDILEKKQFRLRKKAASKSGDDEIKYKGKKTSRADLGFEDNIVDESASEHSNEDELEEDEGSDDDDNDDGNDDEEEIGNDDDDDDDNEDNGSEEEEDDDDNSGASDDDSGGSDAEDDFDADDDGGILGFMKSTASTSNKKPTAIKSAKKSAAATDAAVESDQDSDQLDTEVEQINEKLRQEFEALDQQKEDDGAITTVSAEAGNDVEKGQHTIVQLGLIDSVLESRIRLQAPLAIANRMPQQGALKDYVAQDHDVSAAVASTVQVAGQLLSKLLETQEALFMQYPGTEGIITAGIKRRPDNNLDSFWEEISSRHTGFRPFLKETLEKWHKKTRLEGKNFKAFDKEILEQVDQIMALKDRVVKRTQLVRTHCDVFGKSAESSEGPQYDANIFDDGDFYHELLKELIDRKTKESGSEDPIAMGRHWLEIRKLRTKTKRPVDTKASKGRKLRYEVHTKMVGFMAPNEEFYTASDNMRDDLYASLFSNAV